MDIVPILRSYITKSFLVQVGTAELGENDPLLESGIVDSMGILQLVGFIESEFGIEVDDEEIVPDNFETMANIAAFVDSKLADSTS